MALAGPWGDLAKIWVSLEVGGCVLPVHWRSCRGGSQSGGQGLPGFADDWFYSLLFSRKPKPGLPYLCWKSQLTPEWKGRRGSG